MKLLEDMGHCLNGADTGAQGNGYKEQDCTREIGYKVKSKLEALGHTVVVCSCDSANSVRESLAYRVNKANVNGGDLYLSIHLNAGCGNGVEVYTYGGKHFAEADNVLNSIVALGYQNRGIKDGSRLYVIRNTKIKAMLVECCFIDSSDMSKYNAEAMANAIVKGITGKSVSYPNGWNLINGTWYYYENNSKVINGWRKDSKGLWYFLGGDGAMATARWIKSNNGKWYFLKADGAMATNQWIKWNNKSYYVGSDGIMAVNTIVDGWVVGPDGAWDGKPQIK